MPLKQPSQARISSVPLVPFCKMWYVVDPLLCHLRNDKIGLHCKACIAIRYVRTMELAFRLEPELSRCASNSWSDSTLAGMPFQHLVQYMSGFGGCKAVCMLK